MKSSKKGFNAHGNEHKTHKPSKHDANLRKNGTLHFQIGLLISCTLIFLAFQINFKTTEYDVAKNNKIDDEIFEIESPVFKRYVKPEVKTEVVKEPVKKSSEFKIVDDDVEIVKSKTKVLSQDDPDPTTDLDLSKLEYQGSIDDNISVPFEKVEFVPIFPGCESLKTNAERKKCMSEKIDRIVRKKFRTDKAVELGLTGVQKIYVQFKINKEGMVSDIKIRTPHKILEDEARRVTNLIPQMKPGKQRKKPVEVIFLKPIKFMVQ